MLLLLCCCYFMLVESFNIIQELTFSRITIYDSNDPRSRSHDKASMVLTRYNHLFIHNYIRSLLNIILSPILMVQIRLNTCHNACMFDALAN